MSGVLKSIFGGSETTQQSTSTPINFTDPALKGLSPDLANTLRGLLSSYGDQISGAGDPLGSAKPTVQAPLTGQEQGILSSIPGQIGPNTDRANYFRDVLQGKYLPGGGNDNPFLQDAIRAAQRTTLEGLTETLTRALPGRFTAAGQLIQSNEGGGGGSSAFDRAGAIATRGAANAVGDIATNMSNQNFQNERTQQTTVAGLDQGEVDNTIKGLQASALPRLIQQNGLDQGLALFQQQTDKLLEILKTIGAVQAPTIANQSQSTGSSSSEKGIFPALFPKGL